MKLGTALAIFGALLFALLVLHAWWSTRRAGARRGVVAQDAERIEPALEGAATEPRNDGDAGPDTVPDGALAPLRALGRQPARLDALIDALVPLALDAPISGDLVIAHLPPTRRAGSKAFYIEGLDSETGAWEAPRPGGRYGELQAGVQLASRSGALNEIEYSEFVQKLQVFAEAVGASPDAPDMLDVVARARELDALSGPLDVQLTITLRTQGVAWSVGFVQQVASRHGFVPGAVPGRFVLAAAEEGAPPVLVLAVNAQAALADDAQGSAVRECTLTLDVPQTPEGAEPYPAWHHAATRLAEDLDAGVIDDQGQSVTLHAYAAIGQELGSLYRRLEALDLAAGSAAARRLFS
ncbi:ZipA_C domain-containing protein [Rubrivivax sp. A210]|uniref:cell division protein ZipA C-terminal FtsZ-binding domain-containing protein n=1 Tax=Rubrivivax sp. A210 TaxID=2772301 RepID=UPI001918AE6C|nr:cell division protein ZipA C-terminal FtsZ-binding domain-containing protein [Rubrivivax sp. A210]CAD5369755.1 ZipA_C domain-containing protein [Rubrivivax sp. A210]